MHIVCHTVLSNITALKFNGLCNWVTELEVQGDDCSCRGSGQFLPQKIGALQEFKGEYQSYIDVVLKIVSLKLFFK